MPLVMRPPRPGRRRSARLWRGLPAYSHTRCRTQAGLRPAGRVGSVVVEGPGWDVGPSSGSTLTVSARDVTRPQTNASDRRETGGQTHPRRRGRQRGPAHSRLCRTACRLAGAGIHGPEPARPRRADAFRAYGGSPSASASTLPATTPSPSAHVGLEADPLAAPGAILIARSTEVAGSGWQFLLTVVRQGEAPVTGASPCRSPMDGLRGSAGESGSRRTDGRRSSSPRSRTATSTTTRS